MACHGLTYPFSKLSPRIKSIAHDNDYTPTSRTRLEVTEFRPCALFDDKSVFFEGLDEFVFCDAFEVQHFPGVQAAKAFRITGPVI